MQLFKGGYFIDQSNTLQAGIRVRMLFQECEAYFIKILLVSRNRQSGVRLYNNQFLLLIITTNCYK